MAVNSRNKGCVGERKAAAYLTSLGFPARRGQQHKGGADSPDVICDTLKGLHLEIKYGSKQYINFGATLAMAFRQASANAIEGKWMKPRAVLWYQTGGIKQWVLSTSVECHYIGKHAIASELAEHANPPATP